MHISGCGKCQSTNIHTRKNVGYDVDESGEENQHLDICKDCGAWRFHTERYVNFSKYEENFGNWHEKDDCPMWL